MKKIILSLASITSALTLNLAIAGTMGPVEEINWTGLYLGGNAGYGWSYRSSHLHVPGDFASQSFYLPAIQASAFPTTIGYHPSGFIGGGQLGYNYQFNQVVAGLETDFQGDYIHDTSIIRRANFGTGFSSFLGEAGSKLKWLGTVRARLGYVPMPRVLLYATGGLAYGKVEHRYANLFIRTNDRFTSLNHKTKTGYAAGGGGEWMINERWSAKVEYLYYDLGNSNDVTTAGGRDIVFVASGQLRSLSNTFKNSGNIVRAGINFRFA